MRISEYLPWLFVTFVSLLVVSAVFPARWPVAAKNAFRVLVATAFFFLIGAYWLTTGEKFDETAYRLVLCRMHAFERCGFGTESPVQINASPNLNAAPKLVATCAELEQRFCR